MAQIGILGGTFDPIHEGHLMIAESARECLRLDKVIFMPAGRPWLKSDRAVTDPAHRLAMVELAIEDNPRFEVSTMEIERPGPTYTVDTLTELRRRMGGADLYLILGMDSVRELGRWHRPERIFELCALVAVSPAWCGGCLDSGNRDRLPRFHRKNQDSRRPYGRYKRHRNPVSRR